MTQASVRGDDITALTFHFNLQSSSTTDRYGVISEYVADVRTPGVTRDARCRSGSPRSAVAVTACRERDRESRQDK
jgi:hypothetical protein